MLLAALALLASLSSVAPAAPGALPMEINSVWGDTSWELRYGRSPTMEDAPEERVRVHLEEVLLRLREVDTAALSADTRGRRAAALDALEAYIGSGAFPRNLDAPYARPEFIDAGDRRCAVGAMVEATAGTEATELLDARYHGDSVWAMDGPEVAAWAGRFGFTATELALIQPAYTPEWFRGRTHTNMAIGVRLGGSVYGTSDYRNSFQGLSEIADPSYELGAYMMWQPGTHWGLGAALHLQGNLDDYYEEDSAALSFNAIGEYALPLLEKDYLDLTLAVEAGVTSLPGSPGGFLGVNYGGGFGLSSTLGMLTRLVYRLDVRAERYHLSGTDDQRITGFQVVVTLGAEWRFNL